MSKISAFLSISILCACIFTTCTEDIIIPPKPPPPPPPEDTLDWYNWTAIYVGGPLWDLYVADSNNIYINDGGVPIFFDGQTFRLIDLQDPSFQLEVVRGFDKSNIFFGGNYPVPYGDPVIKKWTNGVITSYSLQNDSGTRAHDILPVGPDEAWISSAGNNNVYYCAGGNCTRYKLDLNVTAGKFFRDPFGTLYVFALKLGAPLDRMYSYKFTNNRFELVAIDTVESPSEKTSRLFLCGKDILMLGILSRIFNFNGSEWVKFLSPPIDSFWVYQMGGYSRDTIFASSWEPHNPIGGYSVRIWDGLQWHREKRILLPSGSLAGIYNTVYVNIDKVYFTITYTDWQSYLVIGRRTTKRNIVPIITNDNTKIK